MSLSVAVFSLLLVSCSGGGEGEWMPAWKKVFLEEEKLERRKARTVYENQDRNGQCWDSTNCMTGFTCENATEETPGTCQNTCKSDADCGNGALCRSGECQKDCAEVGEKCSARRVCCFFDENSDRTSDVTCSGASGDERCTVQETGASVSAGVKVLEEVRN